ncbi:MAG: YicC/YloC family endoribonuclease [Pseudomonadales bacterium]
MTAFARAQVHRGDQVLVWELRSVNHRFLEVQFRMPEPLRPLEHSLRDTLRAHLKRGKIDATLRLDRAEGAAPMALNRALLLQILAVLEQVRRDAPEVGPPSAMDLLRWPGILGTEATLEADDLAEPVGDLFEDGLTQLIEHRHREGTQLKETINHRLDEIDDLVNAIKRHTTSIAHELQSRLSQRVAELGATLEPARLEQEVALLAQRADIAEELDRLSIHVEEARSALRGPGPHGRRLDFLTQELNREANTIASKSIQAQTSQRAVDLKVVIEQIREQVQNIE